MKNILTLIGLAAILSLPAFGQAIPVYAPQQLNSTATCAASAATNVVGVVADCANQNTVTWQLTQQNDASGTADITYVFYRSVDGVTYDSTPFVSIGIPANGTTSKTICTNVSVGSAGYLKIGYVTNAAATANCTNLVIKYGYKKLASP